MNLHKHMMERLQRVVRWLRTCVADLHEVEVVRVAGDWDVVCNTCGRMQKVDGAEVRA